MLNFTPEQELHLEQAQLDRSRERIVKFLRRSAPEYVSQLNDQQLLDQVIQYEKIGNELNLKSERAHGGWALLMVTTDGEIAHAESVIRALRDAPPASSDGMLELILEEITRLEEAERQNGIK